MVSQSQPFSVTETVAIAQQTIAILQSLQAQSTANFASCLYVYDVPAQQILTASDALLTLLGYPSDRSASGHFALGDLVHPADLAGLADHFQRFTTLPYGEVIAIEYRMLKADHTWAWLRSQETPLSQTQQGFPQQIIGLIQDLTHTRSKAANPPPHRKIRLRRQSARPLGPRQIVLAR